MSALNPSTPAFQPRTFSYAGPMPEEEIFVDVWDYNFHTEIRKISEMLETYPYIAMDTEFPGIVLKPVGDLVDLQYQMIRFNVDVLKIIQVGITLADENGNYPQGICTWQFNFKFDVDKDTYAEDSIKLLRRSGIRFDHLKENGIEMKDFAEYFLTSGAVLNPDIKWVTFHSGYDFGYLLKVLTCQQLPESEPEFMETLKLYFPVFYDLKMMIKKFDHLRGSLNRLADEMQVRRIGQAHQAGSDSFVTMATFFKVRERMFASDVPKEFECCLFGLGAGEQDKDYYSDKAISA
mmetsp:Transcript_31434/g.54513  ORF Transcript_31434/g.54513 Transcript_31434/m.54513 type:complete len:292 (+) Transcript_31434:463-1338(+)|eukprot:CAMPEP_0204898364 /NCGR_PEP_ID=MMETSP1397-20131031/1245_1 /ASSEMBLY_ACC=CAM_ASM_000891 /TAXON_ID=49980 /ORGANISM="Climacostomum Climacostomum virens, Strain Stock W-24" /LENGTH=291 /DNA_ID=CAMNT_0052066199 /DNA_START=387 /DNA_END=1262 /DNA_ORIENTATION=-